MSSRSVKAQLVASTSMLCSECNFLCSEATVQFRTSKSAASVDEFVQLCLKCAVQCDEGVNAEEELDATIHASMKFSQVKEGESPPAFCYGASVFRGLPAFPQNMRLYRAHETNSYLSQDRRVDVLLSFVKLGKEISDAQGSKIRDLSNLQDVTRLMLELNSYGLNKKSAIYRAVEAACSALLENKCVVITSLYEFP